MNCTAIGKLCANVIITNFTEIPSFQSSFLVMVTRNPTFKIRSPSKCHIRGAIYDTIR